MPVAQGRDCRGSRGAYLSQAEVARLFGISQCLVQQIEQAALRKLRRHPTIRQLAIDAGLLEERTQ